MQGGQGSGFADYYCSWPAGGRGVGFPGPLALCPALVAAAAGALHCHLHAQRKSGGLGLARRALQAAAAHTVHCSLAHSLHQSTPPPSSTPQVPRRMLVAPATPAGIVLFTKIVAEVSWVCRGERVRVEEGETTAAAVLHAPRATAALMLVALFTQPVSST